MSQSTLGTGTRQDTFVNHNEWQFYKTNQVELRAGVITIRGDKAERSGILLSKKYWDNEKQDWFRSKKSYFMDVAAWNKLGSISGSITSLVESLVSSM